MPKTHRLFMLDIIRILCAVQVEMYHSITMFGCSYGRFFTALIQYLIQPVMTCFFMMSGFSIYYMYHNTNIMEKNRLVLFYLKRAVSILPSYYLVHILYVFIYPNTLSDWIALTPIELLGIQSSYNTLFGILHNGGTWFISCMLLSYLFYPIMQMLLASLNQNLKWGILAVLLFILVYSDYLVLKFGMQGNYSNPIFRMIEFSCGVVLGAIWLPKEHRYVWGGYYSACVYNMVFVFNN
ncbi:acyltransferase [bacterium D16-54]|nr:acyltransferase [bacterium D16-54]RKJ13396.1 acyltransferase [bacterium D16-56]